MNYLNELNVPQKDAATYTDGPLMIVAGPGSGKTRVLTYRIAHLVQQGIDPFNILALTFTNKAANEMRIRIESIIGMDARNLFMGTFHSVFAKILRVEGHRLNYPSNFTIYDTTDSKSVIKALIKLEGLNDKIYKSNQVFYRISQAKNALIGPDEYAQNAELISEDKSNGKAEIAHLYKLYASKCKQNGAMDFDDLLFNMYFLIKQFPEVLYKYQNKFKHILIDEFQDTNIAQYAIIKKLADANQQIAVVGDDAQSIYAFRGATISNIMNFQQDFPDFKMIKLEQNYRSTPQIVNTANGLIKHNTLQIAKKIWTENPKGDTVKLFNAISDNEEGKKVADLVFQLKMNKQLKHNDFAILYRTNAQSRAMEEALRRINIPYTIYGGLSFYQRKEVKDLLAYLRLMVNPNDEEALRRIINYPKRGIGNTTVDKLLLFAKNSNKTLWQIMQEVEQHDLLQRAKTQLKQFVLMIQSFQVMMETKNAYEVAYQVAKSTQILKELYSDKSIEGVSRYENLQELLNGIKEFSEEDELSTNTNPNDDKSLGAYLQDISLLTGNENEKKEQDSVKLMTIHAAKGLEFPVVFVVGLEENLFPSPMSLYTREDLEEERRLFYVAITRAESELYISYANTRYKFGSLQYNEISRFINELPEEYVQWLQEKRVASPKVAPKSQSGLHKENLLGRRAKLIRRSASSKLDLENFEADNPSLLKEGQKVLHKRFGKGEIIHIARGENSIATINFESEGEKKIMLKFAKIKILEE